MQIQYNFCAQRCCLSMAPPSITTWLEQGTVAAANWPSTGIHDWHMLLHCSPSQDHSWVQPSSQGIIILFTQLEYDKSFRALEGFLPIFFFKSGGGKGITEMCSCASCSQGPGFSCHLHAGFQFHKQETYVSAPCPFQLPPAFPVKPWGRIPPWNIGSSKTLLVTALNHFSVTHRLLRNMGLHKGWGLFLNAERKLMLEL